MTRHLIIGAGPAGLNALETIRAIDPGAEIALVGDEPAYARMVLPYFLEGKIEQRAVMTGDDAYFKEREVQTTFGDAVASVDASGRSVALHSGETLAFDRLLIATGSRAARPAIDGLEGEGVGYMWTLDDAQRFLSQQRSHTVIVGAGFIAFTVLDALVARSERVTFVEVESQVLPHMLDAESAALMKAQLEQRGVEVRTSTRLERIDSAGGAHRLQLATGGAIDCDAVVVATGVMPNVEFVRGSGIEVGSGPGAGIPVDEYLQTNVNGVFAAGDVAQATDLLTGQQRVHAIQPTAVDHGRVAGANMAGESVAYAGSLVMNVVAAQGLEACSFGDWAGSGRETQVMQNVQDRIYRKYVWDGDVVVGGILVGPTLAVTNANDVGMLKGLIQTGVGLGPWKAYLAENPLDLRRAFVASGASRQLLDNTLLTGRASAGGGFRFPSAVTRAARSPHHATLLTGKGE